MSQLNPGKIEVELKARLKNPEQVEKEIIKKAKPVGEFIEEDIYFTFANTTGYQKQRFRLRRVQGKAIVTVKIEGKAEPGVEANQEFEFEISDPQAFKVFCQEFGFRVLIEKKKKVKRFLFIPPEDEFSEKITIELNQVENLGYFLELETLVENQNQILPASRYLKKLLREFKIPLSQIESRPYTELLYEKIYPAS